jgi:tetratricopeptide (TPR) repeat protein
MKTLIYIFSLLLVLNVQAQVQDSKYTEAMKNAMSRLDEATTGDDFTDAANTFERIAMNEKGEWLPLYYAAFSYITISMTTENLTTRDQYLDKAQKFIDLALERAPQESELYSLQGFLYPSRIMADPMTRGPELVGKLYQALDEAERLNPENPRTYFLRGMMLLNMPPEFGGGAAVAKPILLKAKEKYDSYQPASPFSPEWGKTETETELSKL